MCVIVVGGAHGPPTRHTHSCTLLNALTKIPSCCYPTPTPPAWIDLCLAMASWQHTQPWQLHQCAGWRGRICLHQRLLMLPQPGAQPKEQAVNTNTCCCVCKGRRCINRLESYVMQPPAYATTAVASRRLSQNGPGVSRCHASTQQVSQPDGINGLKRKENKEVWL